MAAAIIADRRHLFVWFKSSIAFLRTKVEQVIELKLDSLSQFHTVNNSNRFLLQQPITAAQYYKRDKFALYLFIMYKW